MSSFYWISVSILNHVTNIDGAFVLRSKASKKKHNFKGQLQFMEISMGRQGVESWNFGFLKNLGNLKDNAKNIRLRHERFYIRSLQPKLNVKHNKRHSITLGIQGNKKLIKFSARKIHLLDLENAVFEVTCFTITRLIR